MAPPEKEVVSNEDSDSESLDDAIALGEENKKRQRGMDADAEDSELDDMEEEDEDDDEMEGIDSEDDDEDQPQAHGALKGIFSALNTILDRPEKKKKKGIILSEISTQEIEKKKKEEEERRKIEEQKKKQRLAKLTRHETHVLPDITNREFERDLRKIATRGVVKLFNSVLIAQEEALAEEEEAPIVPGKDRTKGAKRRRTNEKKKKQKTETES